MSTPDSAKTDTTMRMFEPLGVSMERGGSGTSWVPDAASLPSLHTMRAGWALMSHGWVFVQEDAQGGPRGRSQFGSANWGMLMASREVAGGRVQGRTELSLDPLTVGRCGYPLLLQTGESCRGQPMHDQQHPHDFLMELGAMYERPVTKTVGVSAYAAPSGEPALGPPAFMHRVSGMDNPMAPIGHHWQDATHITFGVLTAGIFTHGWKLEASTFNGREPDENRWDIDPVRLDSYSTRFTVNPNANWSFTGSYGYIQSPEALHPSESVHRATAAALYARQLGRAGLWGVTAVWGANEPLGGDYVNSTLLESEAVLDEHNTVFGRAEWVQKSAEELVLPTGPAGFAPSAIFGVAELSMGYIRDVIRPGSASIGVGVMGTLNGVPDALRATYGSRTPLGALLFVRLRPVLERGAMHSMPGM